MDNHGHTAIDELPDRADFVLEITNKRPNWFLRFGGLIVMALALAVLVFVYSLVSKAGRSATKKAFNSSTYFTCRIPTST
jgi:hypothetical protein